MTKPPFRHACQHQVPPPEQLLPLPSGSGPVAATGHHIATAGQSWAAWRHTEGSVRGCCCRKEENRHVGRGLCSLLWGTSLSAPQRGDKSLQADTLPLLILPDAHIFLACKYKWQSLGNKWVCSIDHFYCNLPTICGVFLHLRFHIHFSWKC